MPAAAESMFSEISEPIATRLGYDVKRESPRF